MTGNRRSGDDGAGPVSLSGRTVAGRYRVVGVLGQGGIGKVYEAEQIGLDRQVAVKVIRPERRDDEVTTRRFLREARAAGRIASAHVVTLFDCGTDDGTGELYIAMEMLHGQSLSRRLGDGAAMEMTEVLRTAGMIARGLRAAHEAGVLHRDLKPANVFLCDDGNVKVLDFGIAKLLDDEAEDGEPLTQVNRILGTPVYMSPEAATRRPLGPTTDLYALGLLVYEMVVGAPPIKTGDAWKTLEAHVKTEAPRLTQAAPWRHVPPELDELVASLLRKSPSDRPRDAGEVAGAFDQMAVQLAMLESRRAERTEVEVRLPAVRSGGDDVTLDTADELANDDGVEATTLWANGRSGPAAVPNTGPRRDDLAALQKAPTEQLRRTQRPWTLASLSRKQLAIAAVIAGGLTFTAMLILRLIL